MISSSYFCAVRSAGVCEGTLWFQLETTTAVATTSTSSTSTLSLLSTEKTVDYCRLTGCCLECYESKAAWLRGDTPMCILHVVGASAASPPLSASGKTTTSSTTTTSSSTSTSASLLLHHENVTTFKLVTNQGTHFTCQATSGKCREIWLAAFSAGLELLFNSSSSSSSNSRSRSRTRKNATTSSSGGGGGDSSHQKEQQQQQDDDNDEAITEEEDDDDILITSSSSSRRLVPPAPQMIAATTVKQRLMALRLPTITAKKYCISCGAVEGSATGSGGASSAAMSSSSSSSSSRNASTALRSTTFPSTTTTTTTTSHYRGQPISPAEGNSSALRSKTTTATRNNINNNIIPKQIASAVAPLPHYGMEGRVDLCQECATAQGLLTHVEFVQTCLASRQYELKALTRAREACWAIVLTQQQQQQQEQETQQQSTQEPAAETTTTTTTTTTTSPTETAVAAAIQEETEMQQQQQQQQQHEQLTASPAQIVEENPQDDDIDSTKRTAGATTAAVATATKTKTTDEAVMLSETESPDDDNNSSSPDHSSGDSSWSHVDNSNDTPPDGGRNVTTTASSTTTSPTGSWQAIDGTHIKAAAAAAAAAVPPPQAWIHLPPTASSTKELMQYLRDPVAFGPLAKVSPVLQSLAHELLSGCIDVPDFLEQLDEAAGKQRQGAGGAADLAELKKQAFRVAGDMGSAMKLLAGSALPVRESRRNTEVLVCILDFLLDLCQEGELSSVAFFWPQLCHIHLRMLPPDNAAQVARIELMEDFLLTVATRYSVHLALQLVWSHTADLEESLYSQTCSIACRRRRFAVLKFVCELESILFDFDGCWGGGSVSLGRMLSPTGHQVEILGERMKKIQTLRKKQRTRLMRSARLERLSISQLDKPPEVAALEKLQIAKNADYFSCHLNFSRRLADIAEKLRFMDIDERAAALEEELTLLNASGTMGGDPLNNIRESFLRVVRVPSTEGHVFRSKERTPVLLLMEVVDEGAEVPIIEPPERSKGRSQANDEPLVEIVESQTVSKDLEDEEQIESEEESRPPTPPPCIEILEGANDDLIPSPKAGALKRFDQGDSGTTNDSLTPRLDVEKMVSSAVALQLKEIDMPRLNFGDEDPTERVENCAGNNNYASEAETRSTDEAPDQPKTEDAPGLLTPKARVKNDEECDDSGNVQAESEKQLAETDDSAPVAEVSVNSVKIGPCDDQPDALQIRTAGERYETPKDSSPDCKTPASAKKMPTLGHMSDGTSPTGEKTNTLAPTGDVRREVLNAIMMRGKEGDAIAAGAAISLQRSLQELERKRATELLLKGDADETQLQRNSSDTSEEDTETARQRLVKLGITIQETETSLQQTEEDEVMEAIRLLLIQNRVAQGKLSPADAAKVLQHISINRQPSSGTTDLQFGDSQDEIMNVDDVDIATVDAGDVDPRLVGCGPVPPAVLQALTLWKGGMVTNAELLELVKKDAAFVRHSVLLDAENVDKLNEDSAFWGRFAFGERWAEKKARIGSSSPQGNLPGWDLVGVIVKSNDDLRQEAFVMQLIQLCQEAFDLAGLELWVSPYRILATGRTTGVIEMVRNAMSFDALKKRPGYGKGGLREHLQRMTEFTADPGEAFKQAQLNFVRSLAAYSLMSYFFLFKDRHNGNILLDTAGHVIHIDFGFVFGVAPGGSFSLEMSTPFKLTEEMLDVMGGLKSPLFSEFVTLFCCGFLALQSYRDTFLTLVEITCETSTFKCFDGKDTGEILLKLRERFCPDLTKEQTVSFALDLIKQATTSYGTKQYDIFQYMTQGIAA